MLAIGFLLFWSTLPASAAQLNGTVHDTQNGEALARVSIRLAQSNYRVESDAEGNFNLRGITPGKYLLQVSMVGYRMVEQRIILQVDDSMELNLGLSPDALPHKDTVDVHADQFDPEAGSGPTAFALSGTESKNLSSVLADDPMRALQSAPGVSANDDFDSRFSIHGASYAQIGLYLDGILLHEPFHTVQGEGP